MSTVLRRPRNPVPPSRTRRLARHLCVAAATCPWSLTTAGAQRKGPVASDVYLRPQQRVAVEGERRINLYCQGTGEPLSEYSSLWPGADMTSVDDHQLDAAHRGFGDRPLVVLIHDGVRDPPPPGFTAAQRSRMEAVRVASLAANLITPVS